MHQEHRRYREPLRDRRHPTAGALSLRVATLQSPQLQRLRLLRSILASALLLSGTLGAALVLEGCGGQASTARRRDQQEEYLRSAAKAFWHAVRWGYEDKALAFVAEAEQRAELSDCLRDGMKHRTIPDFELVSVVLDEAVVSGVVRVNVQLVSNTDPVLREKRIKQTWRLVQGRWFVEVDEALLSLYAVP